MSRRSILVTGGAGFIGSRICRALLDRGHRVVALDNLDPYYDPAVKRANLRDLKRPGLRFVKGDVRNRRSLRGLLRDHSVDAVIHAAARPGVQASLEDPVATFDVNARGTFALLEAIRESRVRTLLFASSSTVYGRRGLRPRRPFREDDPTEPISPYGASKVAGEHTVRVFSDLYSVRFAILRLFTVYGPRMRPDLGLPTLVSRALAGAPIEIYGRPVRDFTHVDDAVDGFLRALDRGRGVYNIGGGRPVSIRDLAKRILDLSGSRSRLVTRGGRAGDMAYTWADISRARREMGWRPRVPLERGLAEYVEWHRRDPARAKRGEG